MIQTYSTSEIATAAKWIDGKTIYKKTINFGALPKSTYKGVAHGISNLSQVINFEGVTYDVSSARWRLLNTPSSNTGSSNHAIAEITSTHIYIYAGDDKSSQSTYITLYYTKSA